MQYITLYEFRGYTGQCPECYGKVYFDEEDDVVSTDDIFYCPRCKTELKIEDIVER